MVLEKVLCIHYLLYFQKNLLKIKVLLKSSSKIIVTTPAYISKLRFQVYCTNIKAQKINGSIIQIFKIVLASFKVKQKLGKVFFLRNLFIS